MVNKWGSSVIMSHTGCLQFGITIQAGGSQFNIQITPTHLPCAKYTFQTELKCMCVFMYIYIKYEVFSAYAQITLPQTQEIRTSFKNYD